MADPNAGLEEIIADTYDALGFLDRAEMMRTDSDPHDGCADASDIEILSRVLNAVPDARQSQTHHEGCWQYHAACLRDKLFAEMEWE